MEPKMLSQETNTTNMLSRPTLVIALMQIGLVVTLNCSSAWETHYDTAMENPIVDKCENNSSIMLAFADIPIFSCSCPEDRIELFINRSDNSVSRRNISLLELKDKVSSRIELEHPLIRKTAATITANISGDLTIDQICAIYDYIKFGNNYTNGWNYISEPGWLDVSTYANETLELGERTRHSGVGDCDDFAILMASLIEAIGGTSKVILAYGNGTGHAFTEVYLGQVGVNTYDIIMIDQWLKQNYKTNLIWLRFDENTSEVWLNLDWWQDKNGDYHPGGPYLGLQCYLPVDAQKKGPRNAVHPPKNYINSLEWNKKGIDFQTAGEYDDAIRCYDEAIKLDPKYGAPWNNKGVVYIYKNWGPVLTRSKYAMALDCFNTSIALNPYLATAWYNKGLVLYLQDKYYNSMECFEKAIDLRPSYPQAWNNKGLTLFRGALRVSVDMYDSTSENALIQDRDNNAPKQCFEKALELDPRLAEAWNNIGVTNYRDVYPTVSGLRMKDHQDSIGYFDKAIELRLVSALNNKARLYDFWQRDDEAVELYNEALKLDPDNSIIMKNRDDLDSTHLGIHMRDFGYIGLILTPSPPMLVP